MEESIPKLGTERNHKKKLVLQKILLQQQKGVFRTRNAAERNSELFSLPRNGPEWNCMCLLLFLFNGTECQIVASSTEWFGMVFREYAYFCSTVQNSDHFSSLRNGSGTEFGEFVYFCSTIQNSDHFWFGTERNESALFLFHGTEFRAFFFSSERFGNGIARVCLFLFNGTEFRAFFSSAE
jgi:hypothetical protein